ncbi:MAG: hypothetical protein A2057_05975 [Ignavibacteria bacterium GWA2_35_9]|nr:MAG: hypothetical protein A2057_05975 [Ignavibacteria bacterium GWA2_35_9]OGU43271.1 MAG: hypothetical protein A2000_08795 [Ignavibacteria bacterium GWB2_36_8]OGU48460.1 MAG: hypothetical protein A2080_06970 [Ignavibacteria bacterium GWC2_36_12]
MERKFCFKIKSDLMILCLLKGWVINFFYLRTVEDKSLTDVTQNVFWSNGMLFLFFFHIIPILQPAFHYSFKGVLWTNLA